MWHWVQESYRVLAVKGCRLQGTANVYKVLWSKGMGTWVPAERFRVLGTGYSLHGTGYRLLGTGYRTHSVKGTGSCLKGTGYWSSTVVKGTKYRVLLYGLQSIAHMLQGIAHRVV